MPSKLGYGMVFRIALIIVVGVFVTNISLSEAHTHTEEARDVMTPPLKQYFKEIEAIQSEIDSDGVRIRGVLDKFKLWPVGKTLSVCFVNGERALRSFFVDASQDWTIGTSIKFDFSENSEFRECASAPSSDIKVAFFNDGNWSYVGTDSLKYLTNGATLNIGDASRAPFSKLDKTSLKRVILHELGHALGFEHEHQSPESQCEKEFDWPAIYKFAKKHWKWEETEVNLNFRALVSSERLLTTPYNPQSIMHYHLLPVFFTRGINSVCYVGQNNVLSDVDRQAAASVYPATVALTDNLSASATAAGTALASLKLSKAQLLKVGNRISDVLTRTGHNSDLEIDISSSAIRGPSDLEPCSNTAASKKEVDCAVTKDGSTLLISVKSASVMVK